MSVSKKTVLLWTFILFKFILQYSIIRAEYELHRDEFLHLDLGRHLAWGYTSVPPLTGWISWLIIALGNTVFWVKFFPALFGALTILTVWKITEELKGSFYALILGALAVTFSSLPRLNILYQPNSLDVLCWTLLYYTLICYTNHQQKKWLWAAALVFAIGFLNKYNIVFLALGLLPALLLTGQRKWFGSKNFYLALVLALLLISPNLIWQFQNHLPVFKHMKELSETQLVHVNRMDFLKDQLFFFFGGIFLWIPALFSFYFYKPFRKYLFIPLSFFFTILLFTYLKAKSYYAIGLYPVLLAFGAVYLEQACSQGWKRKLKPVLIFLILLFFEPVLRLSLPVYTPAQITDQKARYKRFGALRWEDGRDHDLPQDFADMQGWKELATKVDALYGSLQDKKHVLVICDNYGEAGAINFYSRYKDISAVSFNADYKNWFHLDREIHQAIMVKENINKDVDHAHEKALFNKVSVYGKVENPYAREKGTAILLLSEPKTSIRKLLIERLK
ncbi:glycosyltransferase family 39 protein [Pedobacter nutrimenti]|uniref:Dolichyl-phosphate-mannose-protein mannosyltransferase n=1 Tax=Pedobacter nutrimenti TaxID=1241337 RepID=A0A318U7F8_9SPHI|nr:glycosyltransferase family 39 protein [Pedobacter nutrimenti]PYF69449.1 dolichyl-phosphate-mannose-protein mannosyltransferase [Pedobacter nutrimenti]